MNSVLFSYLEKQVIRENDKGVNERFHFDRLTKYVRTSRPIRQRPRKKACLLDETIVC